jgi:hypothetical protein
VGGTDVAFDAGTVGCAAVAVALGRITVSATGTFAAVGDGVAVRTIVSPPATGGAAAATDAPFGAGRTDGPDSSHLAMAPGKPRTSSATKATGAR